METVGDLLRDASPDLAAEFDAVPIPGALAYALGLAGATGATARRSACSSQPRGRTAMLAGPGVLRDRAVDGLREFAAAANVGVANTWGAKGVFNWDSPHHLGTCGLQARDFELLGLRGPRPAVGGRARPRRVAARALRARRARRADRAGATSPRSRRQSRARRTRSTPPPLFERLAAVAQPGYVDDRFPRHPARAVMEIKQRMAPGGIVTAEPGPAGLWVARTFPTDAPGTVVVPAVAIPGIGVAVALAAARAGLAATAVTVDPLDDDHPGTPRARGTAGCPAAARGLGRRRRPLAHRHCSSRRPVPS